MPVSDSPMPDQEHAVRSLSDFLTRSPRVQRRYFNVISDHMMSIQASMVTVEPGRNSSLTRLSDPTSESGPNTRSPQHIGLNSGQGKASGSTAWVGYAEKTEMGGTAARS